MNRYSLSLMRLLAFAAGLCIGQTALAADLAPSELTNLDALAARGNVVVITQGGLKSKCNTGLVYWIVMGSASRRASHCL
jgi:hypothetical protein